MANPSPFPPPFPPKPGPPVEPRRVSRGFPGPIPRLEGPVAGAVRLAWNALLSAVLGLMVGGFGTAMLRELIEAIAGPMGGFSHGLLSAAGWIAGIGSAAVLFMAYYLDDSER